MCDGIAQNETFCNTFFAVVADADAVVVIAVVDDKMKAGMMDFPLTFVAKRV